MNTKQYKTMLYWLLFISALLLIPGFILLKALLSGWIIIIFALLAMISAFIELKKFYEFEKFKEDFKVDNIARFSNEVRHFKSGKREE